MPRDVLSPISILRQSTKLSGANLLRVFVLFPLDLLVARRLGPEMIGIVAYIALWQIYASLTKPSLFPAALREMPGLLAQGRTAEAEQVQNVGATFEWLYLIIPTLVILAASSVQSSPVMRWAFVLGALGFMTSQSRDIAWQLHLIRQRFGLIARASVTSTISQAVFTLTTIWWLGIYTPLLLPAVAGISGLVSISIWKKHVGFRPSLDRKEAWRLAKVGVILAIGTVLYVVFKTIDRTAVAVGLGLTALGYMGFCLQFVSLGILFVTDFMATTQPRLWAELSQVGEPRRLAPRFKRLTIFLFLGTCVGANLAQAGFPVLVYIATPKFIPAISTFEILALLVVCGTAHVMPSYLLSSSTINKQTHPMVIWAAGIPLLVILVVLAIRGGWGLIGVATASVGVQGLVAVANFVAARGYIFATVREEIAFYTKMMVAFAVTVGTMVLFQHGPFMFHDSTDVVRASILRLGSVAIIWVVGVSGYRLMQTIITAGRHSP